MQVDNVEKRGRLNWVLKEQGRQRSGCADRLQFYWTRVAREIPTKQGSEHPPAGGGWGERTASEEDYCTGQAPVGQVWWSFLLRSCPHRK